jgi:hypothetical protein
VARTPIQGNFLHQTFKKETALLVLPFRLNSLPGISPSAVESQIANAAFTSVSRRSVTVCSLVKEPLAMRDSVRPR